MDNKKAKNNYLILATCGAKIFHRIQKKKTIRQSGGNMKDLLIMIKK